MFVIMHDDHCIAKTDSKDIAEKLVEEHKVNFAKRRELHLKEFSAEELGELNIDYKIIEC